MLMLLTTMLAILIMLEFNQVNSIWVMALVMPSALDESSEGSSIEPDNRGGRYSADRWHPFNHAPMHVAPVTNLPDDNGVIFPPVGPRNAIGNPGFGDSRWLRSTEPLRWASNWQTTDQTSEDLNAFSHWKHMTYSGPARQWLASLHRHFKCGPSKPR